MTTRHPPRKPSIWRMLAADAVVLILALAAVYPLAVILWAL